MFLLRVRGYFEQMKSLINTFQFSHPLFIHRPRKVFESGGSKLGNDEWGCLNPRARPKAMLEVGAAGVAPSYNTCARVNAWESFGYFICKMRCLGAKLHFVFIPSKLQFSPDF